MGLLTADALPPTSAALFTAHFMCYKFFSSQSYLASFPKLTIAMSDNLRVSNCLPQIPAPQFQPGEGCNKIYSKTALTNLRLEFLLLNHCPLLLLCSYKPMSPPALVITWQSLPSWAITALIPFMAILLIGGCC